VAAVLQEIFLTPECPVSFLHAQMKNEKNVAAGFSLRQRETLFHVQKFFF
jgi:hypothetical protein